MNISSKIYIYLFGSFIIIFSSLFAYMFHLSLKGIIISSIGVIFGGFVAGTGANKRWVGCLYGFLAGLFWFILLYTNFIYPYLPTIWKLSGMPAFIKQHHSLQKLIYKTGILEINYIVISLRENSLNIKYLVLFYLFLPALGGFLGGYPTEKNPIKSYSFRKEHSEYDSLSRPDGNLQSDLKRTLLKLHQAKLDEKKILIEIKSIKDILEDKKLSDEDYETLEKNLSDLHARQNELKIQIKKYQNLVNLLDKEHLRPLCDNDFYPLKFVKQGRFFKWYCELCNTYSEDDDRDWVRIDKLTPEEIHIWNSNLKKTLKKIELKHKMKLIDGNKYNKLKSELLKELEKIEKSGKNTYKIY